MTITLDFRKFLFWRRIAHLETEQKELRLGLTKALADNDKLKQQFTKYLIDGAEQNKKKAPPILRRTSEVNAFIGENYEAPS